MLSVKNKFAFRIKVHKSEKHIISNNSGNPLNMYVCMCMRRSSTEKNEEITETKAKRKVPDSKAQPCVPTVEHTEVCTCTNKTLAIDFCCFIVGLAFAIACYFILPSFGSSRSIRKIYRTHFSNWSLLPLISVSRNVKRFCSARSRPTRAKMCSLFLHNTIINTRRSLWPWELARTNGVAAVKECHQKWR